MCLTAHVSSFQFNCYLNIIMCIFVTGPTLLPTLPLPMTQQNKKISANSLSSFFLDHTNWLFPFIAGPHPYHSIKIYHLTLLCKFCDHAEVIKFRIGCRIQCKLHHVTIFHLCYLESGYIISPSSTCVTWNLATSLDSLQKPTSKTYHKCTCQWQVVCIQPCGILLHMCITTCTFFMDDMLWILLDGWFLVDMRTQVNLCGARC